MGMEVKYLPECFCCSIEEKLECFKNLDIILNSLSEYAMDLEYIENEIENDKYPILFKKGIILLQCYQSTDFIKKIMYNYIIVGNYKGKEFLENIVIAEIIIALSQGRTILQYNVISTLKDIILSYFGLDFLERFN